MNTRKVLLLPDLLLALITALLFFGVVYLNDLAFIFSQLELQADYFLRTLLADTPKLIQLAVTGGIALAINIAAGLSLISTRLVLVDAALKKKKLTFLAAYKKSHALFVRLFGVKALLLLLFGLMFSLGAVLAVAYPAALLVTLAVTFLVLLYLKLLFLFVYPVLVRKNKGAVDTLKLTAAYFNAHRKHALFTLLLLIFVAFVLQIFTGVLSVLAEPIALLATLMGIVSFFVNIVTGVWSTVFLFDQY